MYTGDFSPAKMEHSFDFAFDFHNNAKDRIAKALESINRLQERADGMLYAEPDRGILSSTCNGNGVRLDFPPKLGEGHLEFIKITDNQVLMIIDIKPRQDISYKIDHDGCIYLGIQLSREEELVPWIHASWEDVMFVGKYAQADVGAPLLAAKGVFLANKAYTRLSLCLAESEHRLESQIATPGIDRLIEEAVAETPNGKPFFSHFKASGPAKRCAYELLTTGFEGQVRFDYTKIKINELLLYLENHCLGSGGQTRHRTGISPALRKQLIHLHNDIVQNPCADYSLTKLAIKLGIADNRLNAAYKTLFDMPVHQFVVAQRMAYAKKLLEESSRPVSNVARMVGYSDASGFTRAFVKSFGVTPGKLRSAIAVQKQR